MAPVTRHVEREIHPTRRLGWKPKDPDRDVLTLGRYLTGVMPSHPASVDYFGRITTSGGWLLGQNDRFGTCVVPDTRVLTADLRWVRVGDVLVGDRLLGFDETSNGHGRSYRAGIVEQAEIVRKPCYELVFDDGTTVRCSSDHRWLTASTVQGQLRTQQWVHAQDLKCGPTRQSRVIKPLDVWETNNSRDGGYLAGAFDGEGSLDQTRHGVYANRVCFVQSPNVMLAEAERCLKELDYRYSHTVTSSGTRLRVDGTPRYDKHRLEVSPRPEFIRFMGSIRPERLLAKLDVDRLGRINGNVVSLVGKTFIGEQDVVLLETTAQTYLAEGLASHNCGPTSFANLLLLVSTWLNDAPIKVTDDDIIDLYRRSGNPHFDPATGAGDNGVDMTVMLSAAIAGGVGGHYPLAFASVNSNDPTEVWAAGALFGGVLWGADLDVAQQHQTDTGTWDYVHGSGTWGGHAIMAAGRYTDAPGTLTDRTGLVTWQMPIDSTDTFMSHQVKERYVVIFPFHLGSRQFQAGVNVAALAADYTALTGRPFPNTPPPAPTPTPPGPGPTPAPTPAADPLDVQLIKDLGSWPSDSHMGANARAATAINKWATAKHLR